ncbi:cytochrome c oxidase assembly protein [Pseudofrankia sp. BMG5.36]|uniref:cytochrome c oxidase assembly protein n=1 Tax=Pseudofrankia sp. BMG5.36 TaxID=1834512 RepID=UPI0009F47C18|nr:cytochrome c oxidase assembly protein [Pseudofrankia sp. BMG5.36]
MGPEQAPAAAGTGLADTDPTDAGAVDAGLTDAGPADAATAISADGSVPDRSPAVPAAYADAAVAGITETPTTVAASAGAPPVDPTAGTPATPPAAIGTPRETGGEGEGDGGAEGGSGRWPAIAGVAAGAVAMLVTLVVVLKAGGGAPKRLPAELAGADPGLFTGWGLPISRLLCDTAGVATVGALLAAAFLFPAAGGKPGAAGRRMLRWASAAAWVWCVASLAQFAFTVSDLIGRPLPGALSRHNVGNVIDAVPQPRALLIVAGLAFAIAIGAGVARRLDTSAWLAVLALGALLPVAMTGHAHGSGGHDLATVSGGLHVLGVSAWVGGLAALLAGGRRLGGRELVTAVTRYSGIAGLCLVVVAISGVVNAYVRVASWSALLDSRYGNLVIAKAVALVVLAGLGAAHRRFTIRRLAASPGRRRPFLRLGAAEVAVMGVAIALGAGLSRTPTPAGADGVATDDPVVSLLGYPMPPPFTAGRIVTGARPDLLFLTVVLLGAWLYLTGVIRLRRAGASWPVGRTVSWLMGLAVIAFATSSGLGPYGRVLFSVHMAQHLLLMMLAPVLLVLGAPVTLALRALPTGVTGTTRSARAWLLRIVNSRWLAFVSHPVVTFTLYSVSLYVLYLTPLYGWVLRNHLAHLAMMCHFLVVGYLFFWLLIGVDPGPRRPVYPARIVLLFLASAVHTFFGVILMMSNEVIGASYYRLLDRPWGGSLLDVQQVGGGMAWSFGELPSLAVLAALFFQWARTEERHGRAKDARMDSGEDDEFEAYNRYLASLAKPGPRPPRP